MATGTLLDADMATVGRWLRTGFTWWLEELSSLVPESWRTRRAAGAPKLRFEEGRLVRARDGVAIAPGQARGARIQLPTEMLLRRTVELPLASSADLRRMLALDSDRLMPMGSGSMLVAGRVRDRDLQARRMTVDIAGLARAEAERLAAALKATRVVPTAIGIESGPPAFDFLPVLREAGLAARNGSAVLHWWAIAAFLFALNIGLLAWRDAAQVRRLEELVKVQRPMANAAQRIDQRIRRIDRVVLQSVARRGRQDALGMLALASEIVPDGAWVQRYAWDGATLRLAGYKQREINMIQAMRGSPLLADVRNATSDTVAEIPAGRPFDVVARVRPR